MDERQAEPLLLIASFIFDFECIHPFWDGNGRIGRLLTLLLLYQAGYEVGRYINKRLSACQAVSDSASFNAPAPA